MKALQEIYLASRGRRGQRARLTRGKRRVDGCQHCVGPDLFYVLFLETIKVYLEPFVESGTFFCHCFPFSSSSF